MKSNEATAKVFALCRAYRVALQANDGEPDDTTDWHLNELVGAIEELDKLTGDRYKSEIASIAAELGLKIEPSESSGGSEDDDGEWRSEQAQMAGMGLGAQAYNDMMGYSNEQQED